VRPVSQRRLNYLFSVNKVRINGLVISHLGGFTTIPLPLPPFFMVFFISSILILQMANTRRVAANNAENNGESNNQEANLPPPPPLTLEQVLAMQAQMLQTMQQTLVNLHAQPQAPQPLRDRLGDFQRTKPPIFSYVAEPMDADDWLKSVEKKLQVVQCKNHEKVLLASHQLSSPTADWWDAFVEAHEELESINLPEFRATFCTHHVAQRVIKLKKEFQELKQGSMSVNEYITKFTQLSRYAPHEVDTYEKKHECFLNGLNDGLAYALEARDFENFQGMVNKALVLDNRRGVMEHKRKLVRQHQPSSSSRPHVAMSSVGPVFRPAQPQFQPKPQAAEQDFSTPQCQVIQRPNNL
jgi:hypothetical protein